MNFICQLGKLHYPRGQQSHHRVWQRPRRLKDQQKDIGGDQKVEQHAKYKQGLPLARIANVGNVQSYTLNFALGKPIQ
jgi:hypothetical protein